MILGEVAFFSRGLFPERAESCEVPAHSAAEGISPLVLKRNLETPHSLYYRYVFLEYEAFALGVEGGDIY